MKHFGKIKNKTKEGCTIYAYASNMTFKQTWQEFNEKFVITDQYYVDLNESTKKIHEQTNDLLDKIVIYQLRVMSPSSDTLSKLACQSVIGDLLNQIAELNNVSLAEAMNLAKHRLMQVNKLGFMPRGGMKNIHKINEDNKSLLSEQEDAIGRTPVTEEKHSTMADLPGFNKLKEKFNIK